MQRMIVVARPVLLTILLSSGVLCAVTPAIGAAKTAKPTAKAKATAKAKSALAVCAVCGPTQSAPAEPVRATATYKGKKYNFCSEECRDEFMDDPASFLVTDNGKPAPGFTLETLDGRKTSLSDFKGRVVLADFWAMFCAPCVAALPELQALHLKYRPRGFAVLGVVIQSDDAAVRQATKDAKVSYPLLRGTKPVWESYKVSGLPSLVLIGRDGRIIKRYGVKADRKAMLADIERALKVKIPVKKVQQASIKG